MTTVSNEQQALIGEINRLRKAEIQRVWKICEDSCAEPFVGPVDRIYEDDYNESLRLVEPKNYLWDIQ